MDEAHKLSARYDGPDVKETRRYRVGRLAGGVTRHLLLMTATPHSGKEDEFELFMALLDPDRFAGRARSKRRADTRDLMRRLVKENLLRFDGRRLFPERRALSPTYPLSELEARLYQRVSSYVRDEMNCADRLRSEGEGRRGLIVGFALTTLQRRLASSPQAIHESLKRRQKRLEQRLELERRRRLEALTPLELERPDVREHFRDDDEFDEDDLDAQEREELGRRARRRGHCRPHHRGAGDRDPDAGGPGRPGGRGPALGDRSQVGRALEAAPGQPHNVRRPG